MSITARNESARRICFRDLVLWTVMVGTSLPPAWAIAQVPDRESLVEPVFRPGQALGSEATPAAEPADRVATLPSASPSGTAPPIPSPILDLPMPAALSPDNGTPAGPPEETQVARASPSHPAPTTFPSIPTLENAGLGSDTPTSTAASPVPVGPAAIMEVALRDAENMLNHIQQNVRDYTCVLIKRENVNGTVLPTEYILTKVRNRQVKDGQTVVPFSVYMKFLKPTVCKGREVLFVENERNGSVLVREGGMTGKFLPTVTLSPTGRFAMKENRYPISELGIENLTRRLLDRSRRETDLDSCEITYRDGGKVNGRACRVLEVRRPTPKTGELAKIGMNVHLAQVFLDKEWNVPIRYGAYDWPDSPGDEPEVVEEYTYHDLKLNVGLCDEDFNAKNRRYGF